MNQDPHDALRRIIFECHQQRALPETTALRCRNAGLGDVQTQDVREIFEMLDGMVDEFMAIVKRDQN